MKAGGVSVYFNCDDPSYSGRDNQATIEKMKENVVESADESHDMYSTSPAILSLINRVQTLFVCQQQHPIVVRDVESHSGTRKKHFRVAPLE